MFIYLIISQLLNDWVAPVLNWLSLGVPRILMFLRLLQVSSILDMDIMDI
jgi:hypothetical protein